MPTPDPGPSRAPVLWASRPVADNAGLVRAIEAAGAVALDLPLLEIVAEPLPATPPAGDDLWIFTSRPAARTVVAQGWLGPHHGALPVRPRLLAVGPGTAGELVAGNGDGAGITYPLGRSGAQALLALPALAALAGRRVRVFSGHQPLPELLDELTRRGAAVTLTPTHRRRPRALSVETLAAAVARADALLLTSATALAALAEAPPSVHERPLVVPSARVAAAARAAGFRHPVALNGPLTDAALVAGALDLLHNGPAPAA